MSKLLFSLGLTALITLSSPFINQAPAQAKTTAYQIQDYRQLLKQYVSPQGVVNYKGLKKNNGALSRYLVHVSRLSPKTYQAWPKSKK